MIAVGVVLSQQNLAQQKPYYCMGCGRYLFQANRDILVISNGTEYPAQEIPAGMGWLKVTCHKCKKVYNFYWQ